MMSANDWMFSDAEPYHKRDFTFIIIADISEGSDNADKVNTLLEELLPELVAVNRMDSQTQLTVAVLTFSDVCEWLTPMPALPENFVWEPLTAGGAPHLGMVYRELLRRMNRKELFHHYEGSCYSPILLLVSDGESADDFEAAYRELKRSNWYMSAFKFALPLHPNANVTRLKEFASGKEGVLEPFSDGMNLMHELRETTLQTVGKREYALLCSLQERKENPLIDCDEDNEYPPY